MRSFIVAIAIVGSCSAAPAEQAITAALAVADEQGEALLPYSTAELTLTNGLARSVEAVLLRPLGGGPAMRYALTVPPGATARQAVALPAISPAQQYELTAFDDTGLPLGSATADIAWPPELVRNEQFIDDGLAAWSVPAVRWPAEVRWQALGLLAIFVTGLWAWLLIPIPAVRAAVVVAFAALGICLTFMVFIPLSPDVVHARDYILEPVAMLDQGQASRCTVVSSLRTQRWRHPFDCRIAGIPRPVYPDRQAAMASTVEIDPSVRAVSALLRPGQQLILILGPGLEREWWVERLTYEPRERQPVPLPAPPAATAPSPQTPR